MISTPPESPKSSTTSRHFLVWGLILCVGLIFWPVTSWLVSSSLAREQLHQAGILLILATGFVWWEHRQELHIVDEIPNRSLGLLAGSFLCMALAGLLHFSILVLPALGLALAGCLQMVLGETSARFFKPLVIGVVALAVMIIAFPLLDWPLRQFSGVQTAKMLSTFGLAPRLFAIHHTDSGDFTLLLRLNSHTFEVKTECNGFGLMTTGFLLGLFSASLSGRKIWGTVLVSIVSIFVGLGFNVVRILTICLLAPVFPDHYHAMHETVGTIALWLAMGLIAWLGWKRSSHPTPPPTPALTPFTEVS